MQEIDPLFFAAQLVVIVLAIGIHEFCHAKFADMAGDPTPRIMGRVTLNPLAHLDPLGTVMIIFTMLSGFGIGWGKPVGVDPSKMRNPRWDHFISVAAGPISNLVQATIFALAFRFGMSAGLFSSEFLPSILIVGVVINVSLFLFNLIPLGPLDGHWLVGAFLPAPQRLKWYLWNRQVGSFMLLGLILLGQFSPNLSLIGAVLEPAMMFVLRMLGLPI